jgi:transcription termination/antitermination protein NusA
MIDLKTLKQGVVEMAKERKIPEEKAFEALEKAFAAAYQKEYGQKGQIIRCHLDFENNIINFSQIKIVVDNNTVRSEEEGDFEENDPRAILPKYNEEKHILIETAQLLKKNVVVGDEISFPLEERDDFGRIALQTAKQVIIQNMREAEREIAMEEFHDKLHTIVSGTVERVERSMSFVEIGKTSAIIPIEEQIRGEQLTPGSRMRFYLANIDDSSRGVSIRLSRTHPNFLIELFKSESNEIETGVVEILSVAREPGSRSKIAVKSNDDKIDPVGACVGQRGVRVNAITQELHGERIDIILFDENPKEFIRKALSPAKPISIEISELEKTAKVTVSNEELSLAIGKGGQNVRLAARLTGYKIDINTKDDNNSETEADTDNEDVSAEENTNVSE